METCCCTQCRQMVPLSEFNPKKRKNGSIGRMSECKECFRKRQRVSADPAPKLPRPDDFEIQRLNQAAAQWRGPTDPLPWRFAA